MKRLWISFLVLVISLITCINITYYYTTKNALIKEQEEKVSTIVNSITIAIQNSNTGEQLFEDMIGLNLRTASVAAQYALPTDIEKVQNDKLVEIKNKLMIDGLTLLKRKDDDIIGYRSSDPNEIGMSTKAWTNGWFQAFNQLLDNHVAQIGGALTFGQFLPHYWSGPFDTSSTNTKNIDKWGYYSDSETNYIIDPYMHDTRLLDFRKTTGVDATITQMVEKNKWIVEIGVLNPEVVGGLIKKIPAKWYQERKVLYGQYSYPDANDMNISLNGIKNDKIINTFSVVDGKDIMRTYVPLKNIALGAYHSDLLLCIVTDYKTIKDTLYKQELKLLLIVAGVTIISLTITAVTVRIVNRSKEEAVLNVHDVYTGNIDTLFNSIKEQRHDFNNHVSTIHSLLELGKLDALKSYTKEIIGETIAINDILNIDNPAVCAIVQAKAAQAVDKNIVFEHELGNMRELNNSAMKSTDIVKIISNLLDNAFEATTMDNDLTEKKVIIKGAINRNRLEISVFNTGKPIPEEIKEKIFESGYSTKGGSEKNSGLGLAIVKKLIDKYHGNIKVSDFNEGIQFTIQLVL
ncbi:sensor histidine kinase [Paenibacillus sp. SI8]|uniref:sensor histidine kinase n=1 Tax=unclassified Paenibacillus TaxID=185978 RepID=UPI003465405D